LAGCFAIVLIVTGVGMVIYLLTVAAELVLEGTLREFFGRSAMEKRIHDLNGHVIICGFGWVKRWLRSWKGTMGNGDYRVRSCRGK
jgi:hypothetical protein